MDCNTDNASLCFERPIINNQYAVLWLILGPSQFIAALSATPLVALVAYHGDQASHVVDHPVHSCARNTSSI
jgi:hypothetical protein